MQANGAGRDATPKIEFGTDGWRAVIADGFTFDRVRLVTRAIALAIRKLEPPPGIDRGSVVVGYDRRFLSREFADCVSETLGQAGFRVMLASSPAPSQAVSYEVKSRGVVAGVIVTASHNPAAYNGLKIKCWYGGSALPEFYSWVTSLLGEPAAGSGGNVEPVGIVEDYVRAMARNVDHDKICRAGLRILHDPIHGASAGIPAMILGDERVVSIRADVNPSFGGVNPEPIPKNLGASETAMREARGALALAICNDGDADRLGVLDENGRFVSPHQIIALLALYLTREKGMSGAIVKTFSTTRLVEKIARTLGARLHETPIGFKYIADVMLSSEVLIGGEESGGIAFGSFLPERDGILSGLLVAEAAAQYGSTLSSVIRSMQQEFGALYYDRVDLLRDRSVIESFVDKAAAGTMDDRFGPDFSHREAIDGVKLNYRDGTWLLMRRSGTEPMIRLYCESPDEARVQSILEEAATLLGG